jgi:FAD/FMN-containing dehydrogenase
VIVIAKSTNDVADAVLCAYQSDVIVQARAGGHSYAAYSSGDARKGVMVIDLRLLDKVKYAEGSKVAIVEGGIRLG